MDFSSIAPTLLYIRYEEIKFANVNTFASFVESLLILALPYVSIKKI